MKKDRIALEHELELAIDAFSLKEVLEVISSIARLKAHHIRKSYSDTPLANGWIKDAFHIEKAITKIRN